MARPAHRPIALTPMRFNAIVQSFRLGNSIKATAASVDLHERTLMNYLARGEAANEHVSRHLAGLGDLRRQVLLNRYPPARFVAWATKIVPESERIFLQLRHEVMCARGTAEVLAIEHIRNAAHGYFVTETKDVLTKDGDIVTLKSERWIPGDWKAEAWFAERHNREEWGRQEQVALTGADGGPVQVESIDEKKRRALELVLQADDLTARRARHSTAALDAGEPVTVNGHGSSNGNGQHPSAN